jgi:hypothetical protein
MGIMDAIYTGLFRRLHLYAYARIGEGVSILPIK